MEIGLEGVQNSKRNENERQDWTLRSQNKRKQEKESRAIDRYV